MGLTAPDYDAVSPLGAVRLGLSAVRGWVRVKAMGDMTGLVNHMKEAMRQRESEYQSVLEGSRAFYAPSAKCKTLRPKAYRCHGGSAGQMDGEKRTTGPLMCHCGANKTDTDPCGTKRRPLNQLQHH